MMLKIRGEKKLVAKSPVVRSASCRPRCTALLWRPSDTSPTGTIALALYGQKRSMRSTTQNLEALRVVALEPADDAPIGLAVAGDHRTIARFVLVEFERAERRTAGSDERVSRHWQEATC
jgi:hypothetical protein